MRPPAEWLRGLRQSLAGRRFEIIYLAARQKSYRFKAGGGKRVSTSRLGRLAADRASSRSSIRAGAAENISEQHIEVQREIVESARRAHHLQNPQNRPWYRFVTGSLISPLAG